MKTALDHEKLDVYQESIRFESWADELLHDIPKTLAEYSTHDSIQRNVPRFVNPLEPPHSVRPYSTTMRTMRGSIQKTQVLIPYHPGSTREAELSYRHLGRSIEKVRARACYRAGINGVARCKAGRVADIMSGYMPLSESYTICAGDGEKYHNNIFLKKTIAFVCGRD